MTRPGLLPAGRQPLRHGYTVDDAHRMALGAAASRFTARTLPHHERVDIAWYGIVEHLYVATEYPTPGNLAIVGQAAIARASESTDRLRGLDRRQARIRPGFIRYWTSPGSSGLEDRVVERLALPQILATLPAHQREVLLAVAALGDTRSAATALGLSDVTVRYRLRVARRAVDVAWYAPDTPPVRRVIRTVGRAA